MQADKYSLGLVPVDGDYELWCSDCGAGCGYTIRLADNAQPSEQCQNCGVTQEQLSQKPATLTFHV